MGPKDYSQAIRPLFYKNGVHIPRMIAGLGLTGEAGEVTGVFEKWAVIVEESLTEITEEQTDQFAKELVLELSDTLWYVAALLNSLQLDCQFLDEYLAEDEMEKRAGALEGARPAVLCARLSMHAGAAADIIKKHEWHGVPLATDKFFDALANVVLVIGEIADRVGSGLGDVCDANVAKLKKRYPNGFVEGGGVR